MFVGGGLDFVPPRKKKKRNNHMFEKISAGRAPYYMYSNPTINSI